MIQLNRFVKRTLRGQETREIENEKKEANLLQRTDALLTRFVLFNFRLTRGDKSGGRACRDLSARDACHTSR